MLFGHHVNRYYLKYWYLLVIGIASLIVVDYVQLLVPDNMGSIIDGLDQKVLTMKLLGKYLLNLAFIAIAMFIGRFLWRITIFGFGIRVETDLRRKMFIHMESLSQEYFQVNKTGAQMALYTNDLEAITRCFGEGIVMLIDGIFLGAFSFYRMFCLDWLLTLVSAIPLVILACFGGIVGKYMDKKYEECDKAFEDLSDFSQENFSGISVIKAFVIQRIERKRFAIRNKNQKDKQISFVRASVLLDIAIDFVINVTILIVISYGSYLVIQSKQTMGDFSIGDLTRFISYYFSLIWPMLAIAQLINMGSQGTASLRRVSRLLDYKPLVEDSKDAISKEHFDGKIEFKHLYFTYPDAKTPVLKDVSFTIEKGEMVGVIGATGSGKTTIVDLLTRMYNVGENQILFDDIDIMKYKIQDVRRAISYVPQDNFLFGTSIIDNIGFSKTKLTLEEARHFAQMSDVDSNIEEFSDKYATILGERGVTLSGGQKQRISIARSLAKDASVVILDDAVSAVDTATEANILSSLETYHHKKTILMIAHRISTIEGMDKILLMNDGQVIACGTHKELLATEPKYQEIVRLQQLEKEVGEV